MPRGGSSKLDTHFGAWPEGADPSLVGTQAARLFASEALAGSKHYKVACAWYGSLAVSSIVADQAAAQTLVGKYAPYRGTWDALFAARGHVDENVFGIVPLEIALRTGDSSYGEEGLAIANHQLESLEAHTRFAIDDMFMITALQVQAFRVSKQPKYLDAASAALVEYLGALQKADGLFHHHRDFPHKWCRGNGWVAAGMTEIMRELPEDHMHYGRIRQGYERMLAGLLTYQIEAGDGVGLWKQILDSRDARNWPETSGSAMFTYALVTGVRLGWLDSNVYGPAARAAWLALVARFDAGGKLQDISDWAYKPASHPESGTRYAGDEENYYFERPRLTGDHHGQAPLLWSAAALLR